MPVLTASRMVASRESKALDKPRAGAGVAPSVVTSASVRRVSGSDCASAWAASVSTFGRTGGRVAVSVWTVVSICFATSRRSLASSSALA